MTKKERQNKRVSPKDIFAASTKALAPVLQKKPLLYFNCSDAVEVENYKEILLYEAQKIILNLGTLCVQIEGDALQLELLRKDFMRIRGRIFSVQLLYQNSP